MQDEEKVSSSGIQVRGFEQWGNRAVVITGASGGIGKGIAEALLDVGAKVLLSDIDSDALSATANSLKATSENLAVFAADICQESNINALAERALERFGSLYGWVNNAGRVELSPALETSRETVVRQFEVNVVALFQCCQAAARAIGAGGAIVNVASNAGKVGFADMVGYNASKAAVINLTRNLAEEWATRRINVNAVCPGSVSTPMLRQVASYVAEKNDLDTDQVLEGFISHQLGRAIEPLEVGKVIVFLLSDAATIIRGRRSTSTRAIRPTSPLRTGRGRCAWAEQASRFSMSESDDRLEHDGDGLIPTDRKSLVVLANLDVACDQIVGHCAHHRCPEHPLAGDDEHRRALHVNIGDLREARELLDPIRCLGGVVGVVCGVDA